jgi:hypothetical protein
MCAAQAAASLESNGSPRPCRPGRPTHRSGAQQVAKGLQQQRQQLQSHEGALVGGAWVCVWGGRGQEGVGLVGKGAGGVWSDGKG